MYKPALLTLGAMIASISLVDAAPVTLDGMDQITQWTDKKSKDGDTPDYIWGTADALGYDKIGIHIEFNNGKEGSIIFAGVAAHWNTGDWSDTTVFSGVTVQATGYFAENYLNAPFALNNIASTGAEVGGVTVPAIAWGTAPENGDFVSIEYGDDIRLPDSGWGSAVITTYGSLGFAVVPLPATGLLLLGAFGGLVAVRHRRG